jgi:hypothetical protein
MRLVHLLAFVVLGLGVAGCSAPPQPEFGELHPVTGVVKQDGKPVSGGVVRFRPDPDKPEFLINSEVASDGTFSLSTVRTTDKQGERRPGAPAGQYKVTYEPKLGDQTADRYREPVTLPKPVTIEAKSNQLTIELPPIRK